MENIIQWLSDNWQTVLVVFFCLEKIVKLSTSPKDDILVDIVFDAVVKLVGKPKEKEEKQ